MMEEYTLPLSKIIEHEKLEPLHLPRDPENIIIRSRDVIRPGLELNGFYEYFDTNRVAIMGRAEMGLLNRFGEEQRTEVIERYFALHPVAVILARSIRPWDAMLEAAERYEIPLLMSGDTTSGAVASLVAYLNVELAPRITRHGVLMEVYGEGILLVGDSGVGKSEAAIELIKRGHRLIGHLPGGLVPGQYTALYRASGHRGDKRPTHLRHRRREAQPEDRAVHKDGALGRHKGL